MAFRFGFANGDNDDTNADDGNGAFPAPNATEPNVPPVREHGMKELVGGHVSRLSSHRSRNTKEPRFSSYVPLPAPILFLQKVHELPI
jgi:hypothetical protein